MKRVGSLSSSDLKNVTDTELSYYIFVTMLHLLRRHNEMIFNNFAVDCLSA
jgi:hypothetical protein